MTRNRQKGASASALEKKPKRVRRHESITPRSKVGKEGIFVLPSTCLQLSTVLLLGRGTVGSDGRRDCAQGREKVTDLALQSANLGVRIVHAGTDPVVELDVGESTESDLTIDLVFLCGADDLASDDDGNFADASDVRVQEVALEFLGGEGRGEGLAGGVDHAVGDADGLGENAAKTDTGEDIHVVTLAGVVGAGLSGRVGESAVGEGRSGGEEAAAVGVLDSGLKVTLGLGGGVGEGEDERSGVPVGHLAEDLGGEDATHGGETHQDRGLDVVDDLIEGLELSALVVTAGEVDLVVGELVTAISGHKTLGVNKVEAVAGLVLGHAFAHEELDDLAGDTDTGAASTEEDGAVILARKTGALDGVDNTTKDDSASTLDVVIEASEGIAVALQCGEGVLEILELDDDTRSLLVHDQHMIQGRRLTRANAQ